MHRPSMILPITETIMLKRPWCILQTIIFTNMVQPNQSSENNKFVIFALSIYIFLIQSFFKLEIIQIL